MDDAGIVAAMRDRDQAGLASAYDGYADALFTYCMSQLRDRDAAADVVHDTFIVAYERITQLRDPSRLRPWLYAIARNECQQIFRERRRTGALDEADAVTDETVQLGAELRDEELRRLVHAAVGGLNPREREVIELAVRHDLVVTDIAVTMGQSANHVHALLSKARQQLERSLSALIVARTGRASCGTLDGLLVGWDGSMTVLLRKRIARHIESCATCSARKQRDVNATALLATTPLLAAPVVLRSHVLGDASDGELAATNAEIARRAGSFDDDGFPVPLERRRRYGSWLLPVAAALIGAALVIGGMVFVLDDAGDTAVPLTGGGVVVTVPSESTGASPSDSTDTGAAVPAATSQPASPAGQAESSEPRVERPTPEPTRSTPMPTPTTRPPILTIPPTLVAAGGVLTVYCDTQLTRPCDDIAMGVRDQARVVYLVANVPGPLTVTAAAENEEWLSVTPSSLSISGDQVVRAAISIDTPCVDTEAAVVFTVAQPAEVDEVRVTAPACIRIE